MPAWDPGPPTFTSWWSEVGPTTWGLRASGRSPPQQLDTPLCCAGKFSTVTVRRSTPGMIPQPCRLNCQPRDKSLSVRAYPLSRAPEPSTPNQRDDPACWKFQVAAMTDMIAGRSLNFRKNRYPRKLCDFPGRKSLYSLLIITRNNGLNKHIRKILKENR